MRICKVWDDDYPWDVRVQKIGRALSAAGHHVALACRNRKRQDPRVELDGMSLHRMKPLRALPAKVDVGLMFPAFFSPRWLAHIGSVAREQRTDVLMVRDLPLALAGVAVGKSLGLPVVLDMAENYPAVLRAFQMRNGPSLTDRVVRNPTLASWVERAALRSVDRMLVVSEEVRQRMIKMGFPAEHVAVVYNTPQLERFSQTPVPEDIAQRYAGDELVLLYSGMVLPFRGLDTLVEAMPKILQEVPVLDDLARKIGVRKRLELLGFKPIEELPGYFARADMSVIPHLRGEHIDTTVPNKLFDAMAMGRPVVSSDAPAVERILRAEDCGVTFLSGRPDSLATAVLSLRDPARREALGRNGRAAAERRYNWDADAAVMCDVFDSLGL